MADTIKDAKQLIKQASELIRKQALKTKPYIDISELRKKAEGLCRQK